MNPNTPKGDHVNDGGCRNYHEDCIGWASKGECTSNPGYMLENCPVACEECVPPYSFSGEILWNFEYFLVNDGEVVNRWKTGTHLTSALILNTLERGKEL